MNSRNKTFAEGRVLDYWVGRPDIERAIKDLMSRATGRENIEVQIGQLTPGDSRFTLQIYSDPPKEHE